MLPSNDELIALGYPPRPDPAQAPAAFETWRATIYDNVLGQSEDIDSAKPEGIASGNIQIHSN